MQSDKAVVKISGGLIAGTEDKEKNVRIFKGVPYGQAPVGELRFKKAEEVTPWSGVKECTQFGKSPIQLPLDHTYDDIWTKEFIITNEEISEDCLTLNIWAPSEGTDCPVVLYFFGGGFVIGGSSCEIYDGTRFAQKGVIYVTFNHRVGNLSLLCGRELDQDSPTGCSGNCDLLDAISVLEWIQKNIEAFGGDPHNVTIWGQSSGAMEVQALAASDAARGLFRRVVSTGCNSMIRFFRPFITREEGQQRSDAVVAESGLSWEEYRKQPSEGFTRGTILENLVMDGYVLKEDFPDSVRLGRTNIYPFVMGMVSGDYIMANIFRLTRPKTTADLEAPMRSFFKDQYDLAADYYKVKSREVADVMREMGRDNCLYAQLYFVEERKKSGCKEKTYNYHFDHVMPGPHASLYKAFHSAEIPYFNCFLSDRRKEYWKKEDAEFAEYLNEALTGFLKTGEFSGEEWQCDEPLEYTYLEYGQSEKRTAKKELYDLWTYGYKHQDCVF